MAHHYFYSHGLKLHAEIIGQGPAMICLSGLGCSRYNFDFIKEILSQNFTLYLLDNRGMGESEKAIYHYDLFDLAADALLLMEGLGVATFSVFGISMGGFIAQELACLAPRKVKALILACTTNGRKEFHRICPIDSEEMKKMAALGAYEKNARIASATCHPTLKRDNPDLFEKIVQLRVEHTADLEQFILQQKAVENFLKRFLPLESIETETLAIAGDCDRFVPSQNVEVFCSVMPHCRSVLIPQSDHHFFLERPVETAREVTNFLMNIEKINANKINTNLNQVRFGHERGLS